MKYIDIIIPAYNAHQTISRCLFSICYQDISDYINVYIVNDASDKNYQSEVEFFSKFIDICEIELKENVGPGEARNIGINRGTSKYIIFIDADDIFASPIAIKTLLDNIEKNQMDVVVGNFIEEDSHEDGFIFHDEDNIWLHGKIYRRSFLEKNNINFSKKWSWANEDSGFNKLVLLNSPRILYINDTIYFWMNTENSITTKNDFEYDKIGHWGYIENIKYALNTAINANIDKEKIAETTLSNIYEIYYIFLDDEDEEVLKRIVELKKIYEVYQVIDQAQKDEIILEVASRVFEKKFDKKDLYSMELKYTFEEFLEMVGKYE